ncbi:hypothetical protein SY88_08620 [Clostridiales bacterium PH28_bin88]|nr:hypothetical protein SY88_08620 [Clostridiales bacterium PH28_bin88]
MKKAIGLVEWKAIGLGIVGTDAMVKSSPVELIQATTVCPGKYVALVAGNVGAVENAVKNGVAAYPEGVIGQLVLPNVHPDVFPALAGATEPKSDRGALGIIETFSVAPAIRAGDAAAKGALINLLEIRLARGMGGKSLVLLQGEVGAVRTAVERGREAVEEGMLVAGVVIPSVDPALLREVL